MHVARPELKGRSAGRDDCYTVLFEGDSPVRHTRGGEMTAAEKVKLFPRPPEEESPVVVDALAIWNERATSVAGSWFESPPCEALIGTLARP